VRFTIVTEQKCVAIETVLIEGSEQL
jgi:hypothetical protein